jgi:hypothetical protein
MRNCQSKRTDLQRITLVPRDDVEYNKSVPRKLLKLGSFAIQASWLSDKSRIHVHFLANDIFIG